MPTIIADNNTYRGIVSNLRDMRISWDGKPIPDHTTLDANDTE